MNGHVGLDLFALLVSGFALVGDLSWQTYANWKQSRQLQHYANIMPDDWSGSWRSDSASVTAPMRSGATWHVSSGGVSVETSSVAVRDRHEFMRDIGAAQTALQAARRAAVGTEPVPVSAILHGGPASVHLQAEQEPGTVKRAIALDGKMA